MSATNSCWTAMLPVNMLRAMLVGPVLCRSGSGAWWSADVRRHRPQEETPSHRCHPSATNVSNRGASAGTAARGVRRVVTGSHDDGLVGVGEARTRAGRSSRVATACWPRAGRRRGNVATHLRAPRRKMSVGSGAATVRVVVEDGAARSGRFLQRDVQPHLGVEHVDLPDRLERTT